MMRWLLMVILSCSHILAEAAENECDVFFDGHCVVALLTARLNHGHGQMACDEIGGKLANIYSEEEQTLVEDFLIDNKMEEYGRLDLRTGMKFKKGRLLNDDGSESTAFLKWAPSWPQDHRGWHDVILTVVHDWNIPGFANPGGLSNKPAFNKYYMLCEIP